MRDELDRFFTKSEVAKACTALVNLSLYDNIVEPSAGSGAFLRFLPKHTTAYDISPQSTNIIKKDWFTVSYIKDNTLVIGNPPFGQRCKLAKDFIKHAIKLKADTIAFILPDVFNKRCNYDFLPKNYFLCKIFKLPKHSFLLENKSIDIPCSFFVFSKNPKEHCGINLRKSKPKPSNDFFFCRRGDTNADFAVNGNTGKVFEIAQITNEKAMHYIKCRIDKDVLKSRFKKLHYVFYSAVNGHNAWLNQEDIYEQYQKQYS